MKTSHSHIRNNSDLTFEKNNNQKSNKLKSYLYGDIFESFGSKMINSPHFSGFNAVEKCKPRIINFE